MAEGAAARGALGEVGAGVDQQLEGQRQALLGGLHGRHRGQVAAGGVAADREAGGVGVDVVGVRRRASGTPRGSPRPRPGSGARARGGSRRPAPARRSARPGTGRRRRGCPGRRTSSRRRGRRAASARGRRRCARSGCRGARRAGPSAPSTVRSRSAPTCWRPPTIWACRTESRAGLLAAAASRPPGTRASRCSASISWISVDSAWPSRTTRRGTSARWTRGRQAHRPRAGRGRTRGGGGGRARQKSRTPRVHLAVTDFTACPPRASTTAVGSDAQEGPLDPSLRVVPADMFDVDPPYEEGDHTSPTAASTTGSSTASCPGCASTSGCSSWPRTSSCRCSSGCGSWRSSPATSTSSSWSASPASSAGSPPASPCAPPRG